MVPSNKVLDLYHEQSSEPLYPMRQLKTLNISNRDTLILVMKPLARETKKGSKEKRKEGQKGNLQHAALGVEIAAFYNGG